MTKDKYWLDMDATIFKSVVMTMGEKEGVVTKTKWTYLETIRNPSQYFIQ